MQVKNTFLQFEGEEMCVRVQRRSSSTPPYARFGLEGKPCDGDTASETTTASACHSRGSSPPGSPTAPPARPPSRDTARPPPDVPQPPSGAGSARPAVATLDQLLARPEVGRTTVMLRSLPAGTTQQWVAQALAGWGFGGHFDLVFVPKATKPRGGQSDSRAAQAAVCFCFVNFTSEFAASSFCRLASGPAGLAVAPAAVQGFRANLENLRSGAGQPLVIDPCTGQQVPAPQRTSTTKTQLKRSLQHRLYKLVVSVVEKRVANMVVNRTVQDFVHTGRAEDLQEVLGRLERSEEERGGFVAMVVDRLAAEGKLPRAQTGAAHGEPLR